MQDAKIRQKIKEKLFTLRTLADQKDSRISKVFYEIQNDRGCPNILANLDKTTSEEIQRYNEIIFSATELTREEKEKLSIR